MKAALPLAIAAAALAAGSAAPAAAQQRIRHLVVYGNEPCPRSTSDEEITICARRPDTERYRIPKQLRDAPGTDPNSTSWADRAKSLEYVGRSGINSCSPSGPAGYTGCLNQMIAAARAERRQDAAAAPPPGP
ncbi:MAG TPA: hypothetical protein VFW19_05865 [Allosphingosinicella sp.]|nr:hypothetical protein [Allosphingosinicella sp.]